MSGMQTEAAVSSLVLTLASLWFDGGSSSILLAVKLFCFKTVFRCCARHCTFTITNGISTIYQDFADGGCKSRMVERFVFEAAIGVSWLPVN